MYVFDRIDELLDILNEKDKQKFDKGDEVVIVRKGDKEAEGKITEVLDYDPVVGDYQYKVKQKNGKERI
ncbi:MAG: hypothetical protein ACOCQD_01140 [archaeon]